MDYQNKPKEELINDLLELQQKYNSSIKSFELEFGKQKQLINNLEKDNSLLQTVINETTDAIYVKDIDGRYLLFNRAAEIFTGKRADEVLFKDDTFLFPTDEAKVVMDGDKKVIKEGIIMTYEEFVTSSQGSKTIFLSTKGPIFNKNGNPSGLFGIARDITERKQAEASLLKAEEFYRTTLENMIEGCQIIGFDWCYLYLNNTANIHNRRPKEELLGKKYMDIWPGIETTNIFHIIQDCLEKRTNHHLENEFVFPDGTNGWFDLSIQPIPEGVFILSIDITERKIAEDLLIESENKFRKIYEDGPYGLALVNHELKFMMANNMLCQIFGYSEKELQDLTFMQITHIDDVNNNAQNIKKLIAREITTYKTEKRYIKKDGQIIWASLTVAANFKNDGTFLYNTAIISDITERKQTELLLQEKTEEIEAQNEEYQQINEELNHANKELYLAKERAEESEETYRMLFESINDAVFISELTNDGKLGKFIKVNDVACQRLGYTQEELLNKTPFEISSEKAKNDIKPKIQNIFNTKHAIVETEHVTKDGNIIPVEISTKITQLKGKTVLYSIARDITDRNKAATTLKQSEDKFRKAFFTNPDAITITRLNDGMYISANNGFTQIFGYNEEEILGKTSREKNIWHNYEDRSLFVQSMQTKGAVADFETQFNTKNGKIIDALVFATIIELEGVPHALTITRDITDIKKAENDLKASRDLLLNLAQLVPGVIYQYRLYPDGRSAFPYSSPGMFTIYEVTPEEVQYDATPVFGRLHPDDLNNVAKLISESAESLNIFYCEFRVVLPAQGLRWRWSQAHPVRMDDGSTLWHGIISDITERKEAEIELSEKTEEIQTQNEEYQQLNEELIQTNVELLEAKEHAEQSDRLKTAFLQNMSHEIRTPMNAIMGFSELLVKQYNNKTKLEQFSKIINQRCADLLNIINEVLDVAMIESGQSPVTIEECKLVPLFSEISEFFKEFQNRQEKQHINFNVQIDCGTYGTVIRTDKVKLKQILINLIGNAFKFTDNGEIQVGCKLDNNQQLIFYISDTGIGIPFDKQEFIFERFAQLEPTPGRLYGGTGLGLSIVKGLIDLLGGKIWLESIPGKGTTFYFSFPHETVDYLSHEQILNDEHSEFNFTGKTILIVEDDKYNADYLKEVLEGTGIKIIHSFYGNEAIQISTSQKLDIVLMDIRLPDIDGYSATRKIRKSNPNIIIIAQTAYAAKEDKERAINSGCNDFISKPIKGDALLSLINKLLSKK